jgi:hypothetical protein
MRMKKFAAGAAMAGAVGAVALGFGTGAAQAKPGPHVPGVPGVPDIVDGCVPTTVWPPGHNGCGPPGQIMNGNPVVPGLTGVPPGHWLPPDAAELGIPGPLPVVWNPDVVGWGVWWLDQFIPVV